MEHECKNLIEVGEGPSLCMDESVEGIAYSIRAWTKMSFAETLEYIKSAFTERGISLFAELDVRGMLGEKTLLPNYTILDVSKPEWIYQALDIDRDAGLFLPCRLALYEKDGGTAVCALDPTTLFALSGGDLSQLAGEIKGELQAVFTGLMA